MTVYLTLNGTQNQNKFLKIEKLKEKITIYTNETCPYCEQIKNKLKESEIDFVERQTKDWKKDWKKITYTTGIGTVPTVLYQDTYFVPGRDFQSPDHLIEILNNFQKIDMSNVLVLEKIKTLNYNIMMALQNLDVELKKIDNRFNSINL